MLHVATRMSDLILPFDWSNFLSAFSKAAQSQLPQSKILFETNAGPLTVWERTGSGPCIYLSAGIHGDEPAGPLALLQLLRRGTLPANCELVICPALNPTGLAANTRANAQGIDLNRDYFQRRTSEVRAHSDWLASRRVPDLFLSLHEDTDTPGFYLYEINCKDDEPRVALDIIKAVAPIIPTEKGSLIDNHTPRAPGWIYHPPVADIPDGWPEAIYLANIGCPLSFTFETPLQVELQKRVEALCAAVETALRTKEIR